MIDATKLVDGQWYWIRYCSIAFDGQKVASPFPEIARWNGGRDFEVPSFLWSQRVPLQNTGNQIPIPSPERLAEMWEVIERVATSSLDTDYPINAIVDSTVRETARKLLEKRT